jgi:glucosamine-6-phosphate deaminase
MPSPDYENMIRNAGGIDLLVLGIGTNGHIAFNEPGAAFDTRTRIVNLASSTRELMRAAFVPDQPPVQGITMGVATILEARRIILLASGARKAPALAGALHGPITVENPASALRLHGDVTVIADESALSTDQGTPLLE